MEIDFFLFNFKSLVGNDKIGNEWFMATAFIECNIFNYFYVYLFFILNYYNFF